MTVAILAQRFSKSLFESLKKVYSELEQYKANIFLYKPLYDQLTKDKIALPSPQGVFSTSQDIPTDTNFFLSLGGDGTFLLSASFVRDKGIPIVGINAGRLGFLANISQDEISQSFAAIAKKEYLIENRALIQITSPLDGSIDFPFALNDVTIQKTDASLININAFINDDYLNEYWTDGLIISTPTGSTAYSMSVGGPIVCPECKNFIISPIASHNLSVRPLIIDYNNTIKLQINSRNDFFLLTIDSKVIKLNSCTEIIIKKADFEVKTIKFKDHSFYNTIRQKLMWGIDARN